MREKKNPVLRYLDSQQVRRCVGENRRGVTLVVRKSIDCHSRHYSLSQETKAIIKEGNVMYGIWCCFMNLSFVLVCAHM